MKKTMLIVVLIGIITSSKAQNIFTSSGNVGIGTNSPNAHLEVIKNFNGSNSAYFLNQNSSANSRVILLIGEQPSGGNYGYFAHHSEGHISNWGNYTSANSTWLTGSDINGLNIIAGNSQGKIVFGTGSSEKMRLAANGNLGIGTTDPGVWKLAVNGNIRAKEIKVETGWSDFVFYDDYKLPSLKEVETYIKEKGHLKDIPSAKEVDENGIFLGEMDSKLLQKIEELILYTIKQQKEIETLKEEKKELKSINRKLLELQKRLEKLEKK